MARSEGGGSMGLDVLEGLLAPLQKKEKGETWTSFVPKVQSLPPSGALNIDYCGGDSHLTRFPLMPI